MKKLAVLLASLTFGLVASATVYRPGLVQAKFESSGGYNFFPNGNNTPVLVSNLLTQTEWPVAADKSSVASVDFTYGSKMADTGNDFTNPWSGRVWGWSTQYSVFAYEGEIYLHQGDKITATGRFDDGSGIVVNGVTLFMMANTSGYNAEPSWHNVYEAPADGWYPVNAWVWDWTGGKVVCGSYVSGIQYNLLGLWQDFTSADVWSKLADPGDGSVLRIVDTNSYMNAGLATAEGDDAKVTVSFTGVPYAAELRAYYGPEDGGTDLNAWDSYLKVADVAAGDTASAVYTIPGGVNFAKTRLVLYRLAEDASPNAACTSFYEVGNLIVFEQVSPTVNIVQSECSMVSLGFDISLSGFGTGASSSDLHVVLASDDQYQDVLGRVDKTASEVQLQTTYPLLVSNLNFNTQYYLKVEATNDQSQKRTIEKVYSTLPAPACSTALDLEKGGSTFASFFWSLSGFGEMSSYASVSIEWAYSPTFATKWSQEILARLETPTNFVRVVVRDLTASEAYYFRLKTVNECGTVSYAGPILVNTTASEVGRTWANTGTDMNDPNSYVELSLPGDSDKIYFTEPMKVQPYLTSSMSVKGVYFGRYDGIRTTAERDPVGYVISGAEGAKLTLTGTGNGINYAVNSCTMGGEVAFEVPVVLSGSNNPHLAGNGTRVDFRGPLSTSKEYEQDVQTQIDGKDDAHLGRLVFSAANPDFKPSKVHWTTCRFEIRHPQAMMSLKKVGCGNWGGWQPVVYNTSGVPVVLDLLEQIEAESYGLNSITFEGSPIVMTNCSFKVSMRDNKPRFINAAVSFKTIGSWDYEYNTFCKYGTNMLEIVDAYYESPSSPGHLFVGAGMLYPHDLLGTVARSGRRCRINGDGASVYPTIGVDADARIPVSDLGGISFGKDNENKPGGLSGMGGEVSVTLTDTSDSELTLVYGEKTTEGVGYTSPSIFAFGNVSATGTVKLENDITRTGGQYEMRAFKGKAKVDGRYAGDLTVSGGNFYILGDGVLAIEGSVTMDSDKQFCANAGGTLVNTDLSGLAAQVRLNGSGWIGGTGTVKQIWKEAGNTYGAIRPGEFGTGTLTVAGTADSKLAANSGFIVDITAGGTTGLLKLDGDISKFASGWTGYWMRIEPQEGAPAGKYKIMDWSDSTGSVSNIRWIVPGSFTVQYDPSKVRRATLSAENKAMYIDFVPASKTGLRIILR